MSVSIFYDANRERHSQMTVALFLYNTIELPVNGVSIALKFYVEIWSCPMYNVGKD